MVENAKVEVELEPPVSLGEATGNLKEKEMEEKIREQLIFAKKKAEMKKNIMGSTGGSGGEGGEGEGEEAPKIAVPPEIPEIMFHTCGVVVGCPKFDLDKKEAEVFANSLSELIGPHNSKFYHLIVILLITASRVIRCKDAIKQKFEALSMQKKKDKKKEEEAKAKAAADRAKQASQEEAKKGFIYNKKQGRVTYADNIFKSLGIRKEPAPPAPVPTPAPAPAPVYERGQAPANEAQAIQQSQGQAPEGFTGQWYGRR